MEKALNRFVLKGDENAMKMRVADYIVDTLYQVGAKHAFLITGGMIMPDDAL